MIFNIFFNAIEINKFADLLSSFINFQKKIQHVKLTRSMIRNIRNIDS